MAKIYSRICKYCGKEFESTSYNKQICSGPHYQICPVCGKQFEVEAKDIYRSMCCSDECKKARRNSAVKEALAQLPEGWNKSKQRFTKVCKYCGETFITDSPSKLYCNRIHYKTCSVCGKQFPITLVQIFNGTQTCSNECRVIGVQIQSMSDAYCQFAADPKTWVEANWPDGVKPTYRDLAIATGAAPSTIQQCLARFGCEDTVNRYVSIMEQEVIEFLKSITDCPILTNCRDVIRPKELDIYIPDKKLAIECNPTYTHNSSTRCHDESPKPADYHKMKTDLCEKQGIRLIHIFGYEWIHKRLIIESILKSAINLLPNRIYARDCVLREVSSKEASEFLECNHRQGAAQSRYRYGLYYYGELVALMTFSKMRRTIGTGNEDTSDCYELVRFCNKLDTTVVGGGSRLFKHFIHEIKPNRVRSFSDRAHTTGKLYDVLGFKEHHRSGPGYVWVDTDTDIAYNRVNAQKHNLKKFLNDEKIDLSQSESQIMVAHGFVKVYDSGTICWEWVR